ncbi:MAG: IS66 family transposase [Acidobacteriota bacterium]
MREEMLPATVSEEDWANTAESVKQLFYYLGEKVKQLEERVRVELEPRITALEEENRYLREQLGRNSSNSSQPPSTDAPDKKVEKKKPSSGKKRGGQKGHRGHWRELLPSEECQKVEDCYPQQCRKCGKGLSGKDPAPYRHQVVEIPEIKRQVEEYRLHQLECEHCGTLTRAKLPALVPESGYGVRVIAIAAILSGLYRLSERMLQTAMKDLFGVTMALGTVNALRQETSSAIAAPVEQAAEYVKQQPIINSDETGFMQGNADGKNPEQRKAWRWVAVTELVTVFRVTLSRSQQSAQQLLGIAISAILITDRWTAYNWLAIRQRQLCWAHLKRDFTKISERRRISGQIGKQLLEQEKLLFTYWHRVRDGTLKRSSFTIYASVIRQRVKALLQEGADYEPAKGEQTARARTARTCEELLKLEAAMWLFVRVPGVEPTNNAAERAIRHFVLWRKNSFGAQSAEGSLFVARILTVVMTLRAQNRNVLDYFVQACQAAREGKAAPSILPVAA